MRDRATLAAFVLVVAGLSFVHSPVVLAVAIATTLLFAGRDAPRILGRALVAVALFGGAVSAAHAAACWWRGEDPLPWLLRANLRVLAMTSVTLLAARRIDLVRAASVSRSLQFVVVLALTQIAVLRRLADDARLALRSRTDGRPSPRLAIRSGGAVAAALVARAEHRSRDVTHAMTSRGFFDDADPR